jgi:plasmid stability protein
LVHSAGAHPHADLDDHQQGTVDRTEGECATRPTSGPATNSPGKGEAFELRWYHSDTREAIVANLLLRDLDEKVLERLKAAAKAHRRSLQAEIHDALAQASARSLADTRRLSARWLKRLQGRVQSDSVALIREDRDR